MRTVGSIIFAVLMFELIIVIHEFGHYIVARLNKVKVNEFAIGMGPAIFKKQGKNTLFALRIIPFGGYCAMEGEDGDSDDSGAFCKKKVWRRITIVIAGVVQLTRCIMALIEALEKPSAPPPAKARHREP